MASEPPLPPRRATAADAGEHGRPPREDDGERIGPLAVERHRKDDGRSLILYARVRDASPRAPGGSPGAAA